VLFLLDYYEAESEDTLTRVKACFSFPWSILSSYPIPHSQFSLGITLQASVQALPSIFFRILFISLEGFVKLPYQFHEIAKFDPMAIKNWIQLRVESYLVYPAECMIYCYFQIKLLLLSGINQIPL